MKPNVALLLTGVLLSASSCGSSNNSEFDVSPNAVTSDAGVTDSGANVAPGDMGTNGPISTSAVLCGLNESGEQQLVYLHARPGVAGTPVDEVLGYTFAWTCDATGRSLSGNGVPNHTVENGEFATQLTAQTVSQTFPIEPAITGAVTEVREPGYALNSVKFDPATAGTCPDDATDDADCNYAMGSDAWGMVATPGGTSPWRFDFGVDDNDAHVQPNGQYHYHGTPVGLVDKLNPNSATSMTLVGWASDGFPIYSRKGYTDAADSTSAVVEVQSSYQTIANPPASRPSLTDFPLGHFTQDWEYAAGSGDLDECNGRFGVTPEFPNGIYHYYITNTYPFIQRCVRGA